MLRMLDEEAKSEEELAEAQAEASALEGKVKKQEETYKAEKASLESAMAEKVRASLARDALSAHVYITTHPSVHPSIHPSIHSD